MITNPPCALIFALIMHVKLERRMPQQYYLYQCGVNRAYFITVCKNVWPPPVTL